MAGRRSLLIVVVGLIALLLAVPAAARDAGGERTCVASPMPVIPFTDVAVDSTFCVEIAQLADTGITQGRGDGTFGVGDPVTRGAMAAFLIRFRNTVEVTGLVTAYAPADNGGSDAEAAKLVRVAQWGDTGFSSLARAFQDAENLTRLPANSGGTQNVTDMTSLFSGATSLTSVPALDTSSVTTMDQMFQGAPAFNADLSGWCVSQIPEEPTDFDTGAVSWTAPRPIWGAACA